LRRVKHIAKVAGNMIKPTTKPTESNTRNMRGSTEDIIENYTMMLYCFIKGNEIKLQKAKQHVMQHTTAASLARKPFREHIQLRMSLISANDNAKNAITAI